MGNKQSFGKEKDVVSHLRASSTALSWSYTSLACLLALVVICRKVIYIYTNIPTVRGQGSEARFLRAPRMTLRGIVMQIYIRSCERAKDMTLYIRMRALVRMHDLTTCARACR